MDYKSMADMHFSSRLGSIHYKFHKGSSEKTLVLLHGFGASSLSWSRFIEQLPDELNIVAPDLLGHGSSAAPKMEYTISNQADSIKELLKSISGQSMALMGHSYGGWIAAVIAMQGIADYLILEDAAGITKFDDERLANDPDFAEKLIKEALVTNPNEHVLRSIIYSRTQADYLTCEKLSRIRVPSLIIWGNEDLMVPVKFAYTFNSCISGSEILILEGAKHTPHYTDAKKVADKVLSFLAQRKKIF